MGIVTGHISYTVPRQWEQLDRQGEDAVNTEDILCVGREIRYGQYGGVLVADTAGGDNGRVSSLETDVHSCIEGA